MQLKQPKHAVRHSAAGRAKRGRMMCYLVTVVTLAFGRMLQARMRKMLITSLKHAKYRAETCAKIKEINIFFAKILRMSEFFRTFAGEL